MAKRGGHTPGTIRTFSVCDVQSSPPFSFVLHFPEGGSHVKRGTLYWTRMECHICFTPMRRGMQVACSQCVEICCKTCIRRIATRASGPIACPFCRKHLCPSQLRTLLLKSQWNQYCVRWLCEKENAQLHYVQQHWSLCKKWNALSQLLMDPYVRSWKTGLQLLLDGKTCLQSIKNYMQYVRIRTHSFREQRERVQIQSKWLGGEMGEAKRTPMSHTHPLVWFIGEWVQTWSELVLPENLLCIPVHIAYLKGECTTTRWRSFIANLHQSAKQLETLFQAWHSQLTQPEPDPAVLVQILSAHVPTRKRLPRSHPYSGVLAYMQWANGALSAQAEVRELRERRERFDLAA